MCKVSDHRSNLDYDMLVKEADMNGQPTYIELEIQEHDDIKLKLLEIESRERAEYDELMETVGPRPTEEEEEEEAQAAVAPGSTGTANSSTSAQQITSTQSTESKKQKKVNPKKELPEAVKNKMTNNAALMAAGGTVKSWMLPGATISAPTPRSVPGKESKKATSKGITVRTGSRLRIQKRITIKDALFVMESQHELRNSELLYKWWANVK